MTCGVLFLDDEPWQLTWAVDLVEDEGGRSIFVSTYDEARLAFDREAPQIVVVDIRIGDVGEPLEGATLQAADPNWVGLRFLRFVRVERKSSATQILVYTGLDRDKLQEVVENGFQALYFTKFEPSYFQDALVHALRKCSAAGS